MIETHSFFNPVWATPYLPPIPREVCGKTPRLPLSGREEAAWRFCFGELAGVPSPFQREQDYDFSKLPAESWAPVAAPASLLMQGYDIRNNREYYYQREVTIPEDFPEGRLFLRFEGVYSNARVWIDGRFIRAHVGGFTMWDCDITAFVKGPSFTLTVGVADLEGAGPGVWNPKGEYLSDAAWASYYAHHNIGGILRDVTLFALPQEHILRTHLDTHLDETLQNGALTAQLQLDCGGDGLAVEIALEREGRVIACERHDVTGRYADPDAQAQAEILLALHRPHGRDNQKQYENDRHFQERYLPAPARRIGGALHSMRITLSVPQPALWDAEHPRLYGVRITLLKNGVPLQTNLHRIGFRQICYGGMRHTEKNKVYVNGREVKLRGVCRHDVSWRYGRSVSREEIRAELLAYRRNNINFLRTSHYPAPDYLLELCDELGFYVEQENSACFKGANQFDIYCPPEDFLNSFAEMVESGRNHPCVLIWSLANESGFETTCAFRREYDYIKAVDRTRPVIFSYPFTVRSRPLPYDIYSKHYQKVDSRLGRKDLPVLHDEFAHVPCYNLDSIAVDNSSRVAWGNSIKTGWDHIFETDGALGCAIWAAIDDVFFLPEGTKSSHQSHSVGKAAGYGEWGAVLDAFYREKPEAYLTKKAFSPILLDETKSAFGEELRLFVQNRFDHTDLSETRLLCRDETGRTVYNGPVPASIAPHTRGEIRIGLDGQACEKLSLEFYANDLLVDVYELSSQKAEKIPAIQPKPIRIHVDAAAGTVTLTNPENGLPVAQGPYLYANGKQVEALTRRMTIRKQGEGLLEAELTLKGQGVSPVKILLRFDGKSLRTDCTLRDRGAAQCSIGYALLSEPEAVTWKRQGQYAWYPENHIGRNEGTAYRSNALDEAYGKPPQGDWKDDRQNHFLFTSKENARGCAANDFRTRRNNILFYAVRLENRARLALLPRRPGMWAYALCGQEGRKAALTASAGEYYPDLQWGNAYGPRPKQKKVCFDLFLDFVCNRKGELYEI